MDMRRSGFDSCEDNIYARSACRHMVHLAVFQGEHASRDGRRQNEVILKKELKTAAAAESADTLFAVAL